MPFFGGNAKHAVLCRGRVFTGRFDDCFNDGLPILEMLAPLVALALLYPFARFAFSAFAPEPAMRQARWRFASRHSPSFWHPVLTVIGAAGCCWALWRLVLYPFAPETLPYLTFWAVFAGWFVSAGLVAARASGM